MAKVHNLLDDMALACECGCVGFNYLKSHKLECESCGKKIDLVEEGSHLNGGLYMNDESKHITKKIILMASWAITGGYFVIASNGGGGATCAIMSFVCGFMVARNMADIVTHDV